MIGRGTTDGKVFETGLLNSRLLQASQSEHVVEQYQHFEQFHSTVV